MGDDLGDLVILLSDDSWDAGQKRVDIVDENSGGLHDLLDTLIDKLIAGRWDRPPLFISDRLQQRKKTRLAEARGTKEKSKDTTGKRPKRNRQASPTVRRGRIEERDDETQEETERTMSEKKPTSEEKPGDNVREETEERPRGRCLRREREGKRRGKKRGEQETKGPERGRIWLSKSGCGIFSGISLLLMC
ncbi:hypothetical protein V1521DRAFT_457086 [Lipomyces starkeyi]